MNIENMPISEN